MQFKRRLAVTHHPTGTHYSLAIPGAVAQALSLEDGGLVSLEPRGKRVILQAYRDTPIPWREAFNPQVWLDPQASILKPVPVPPNTLGPSRPTATGKVIDFHKGFGDGREAIRYLRAMRISIKHKMFPHGFKRGPKPGRRR